MCAEPLHRVIQFENGRAVYADQFDFYRDRPASFGDWFVDNGKTVHKDRNELKVFSCESTEGLDRDIVVKSFKVPGFLSRVIYSFFRSSKARRSYENSYVFLEKNFPVPQPLAYIEEKTTGLLTRSYFISERVEFDCSLHEVFRKQMFEWAEILPLAVEQAYLMHESELLHLDYSPGNVLIRKTESGYGFFYVDLNRVRQGKVSFEKGLKSFARLAHDEESQKIISETYARLSANDESRAFAILSNTANRHQRVKRRKNSIKKALGLKK